MGFPTTDSSIQPRYGCVRLGQGLGRSQLQRDTQAEPWFHRDAEARQRRLETDLQLTNVALLRNPKNYSVWEHRKWVLNAMPAADWGAELALVDMYLQKDGRNCASFFGSRVGSLAHSSADVQSELQSIHGITVDISSALFSRRRKVPRKRTLARTGNSGPPRRRKVNSHSRREKSRKTSATFRRGIIAQSC